jgi:hypothetical protein
MDASEDHGVEVICEIRFARPILSRALQGDSVLGNMLIMRAAQGTNVLLKEEEAKNLASVIKTVAKRHRISSHE